MRRTPPETRRPIRWPPQALSGALLALALALTGAAWADAGQGHADDAKLKKNAAELEKLRDRIDTVNKSIEADRSQKDALRGAVEAAERKLADAQGQVRKLGAQIDLQSAKVKQAQEDQAAAEHRLAEQKDALALQMRAAYMLGTGGRTELLLSQDEPDRVGRLLMDYDYLARARKTYIDRINADIEQAAALAARYQSELDVLRGLQSQRKSALADIESDRAQRRQAMNQVQHRLAGESEELKRLQGNEKQLQNLLESLKRALASAPPPTSSSKPFSGKHGSMQWPLRGDILANYGDAKAGGRLQWKGIWIEAPEGAAVHACASGRVAYVGWLSSFGLIVVLEHERGLFTLYGHNSSVGKAVGDSVNAGDVIAAAGNTGGYEQPGLYFEVRKGTDPMDPREWLTR